VRHWLTPRCILIMLMLVAAPGAALAHLLVAWVPGHLEVVQLNRQISQDTQQLDAEWTDCATVRQRTERLQQVAAETRSGPRPAWLPQRDRHRVFDSLAEAVRDERVTIEQLTLGEPGLYAAASRSDLLACERITVDCTGDYAGLAACLDRVDQLDLPIRFAHLSWGCTRGQLALSMELEVPFVPDDALNKELAETAEFDEVGDEP
jgi:hypothetical protein